MNEVRATQNYLVEVHREPSLEQLVMNKIWVIRITAKKPKKAWTAPSCALCKGYLHTYFFSDARRVTTVTSSATAVARAGELFL